MDGEVFVFIWQKKKGFWKLCRRYNGLVDDVEIWSFDVGDTKDKDNINIKREPGNTWYKQLYG